jgi:hypothetical protein
VATINRPTSSSAVAGSISAVAAAHGGVDGSSTAAASIPAGGSFDYSSSTTPHHAEIDIICDVDGDDDSGDKKPAAKNTHKIDADSSTKHPAKKDKKDDPSENQKK